MAEQVSAGAELARPLKHRVRDWFAESLGVSQQKKDRSWLADWHWLREILCWLRAPLLISS